jgi:hypothetical protein
MTKYLNRPDDLCDGRLKRNSILFCFYMTATVARQSSFVVLGIHFAIFEELYIIWSV